MRRLGPGQRLGFKDRKTKREDGFVSCTDGAGWQMDVGSRKMDRRAFESSHRVVGCKKRVLVFVSEECRLSSRHPPAPYGQFAC